MAINFPSSPSVGDVYTDGTRSWRWNGSGWVTNSILAPGTLYFDDIGDVDMSTLSPSEGDIAYFDGTNWVPFPFNISSAAGVSVSSPSTGQFLKYDGTNWVNATLEVSTTLEDLTDTTITSVAEGEVLVYRVGSGWVNEPPSTAHPLAY